MSPVDRHEVSAARNFPAPEDSEGQVDPEDLPEGPKKNKSPARFYSKDGNKRLDSAERKAALEFLKKEAAEGRGRRGPRGPRGGPPREQPSRCRKAEPSHLGT